MSITETQIYALAAAKQSGKGTPAAAPTKRFIQLGGGDFNSPQDIGSENWSNLTRFGDQTDWINSVLGSGNPACEADVDGLAYLMWLFAAGETVTTNATNATLKDHVAVPTTNAPLYSTWWTKIGNDNPKRNRHDDCRVGAMQIEASSANKAVRMTPSIVSLDPAKHLTADPTWPTQPTPAKVLIYTEASGTFEIDTVTIRGHSQFTVVLSEELTPVFTDDTIPFEVNRGTPTATIACTIQADADGLAQFNKLLYGTTTPTNGQAPQKRVPALGSYEFNMQKFLADGTTLDGGFKFEMPGVRWTLPDYPGPNPDGGEATLALAGSMRINAANPGWRTTVTNALATYTA